MSKSNDNKKETNLLRIAELDRFMSLGLFGLANRDFSGLDLSGRDFSDKDLTDCNFKNSIINGCDFSRSIAERCNFSDATAEDVDFTLTTLRNTIWDRAIIKRAINWGTADIKGSNFQERIYEIENLGEIQVRIKKGLEQLDAGQGVSGTPAEVLGVRLNF